MIGTATATTRANTGRTRKISAAPAPASRPSSGSNMKSTGSGVDQQTLAFAADRERCQYRLGLLGLAAQPAPAVAAEALEWPEARLVGHPRRAIDPIAEIDVGQAGPGRADDMVEDDERAEPLAGTRADV